MIGSARPDGTPDGREDLRESGLVARRRVDADRLDSQFERFEPTHGQLVTEHVQAIEVGMDAMASGRSGATDKARHDQLCGASQCTSTADAFETSGPRYVSDRPRRKLLSTIAPTPASSRLSVTAKRIA